MFSSSLFLYLRGESDHLDCRSSLSPSRETCYVFQRKVHTLRNDVCDLSSADLSEYILVKDAGTELLFMSQVDPKGTFGAETTPWKHCTSEDDCYTKLMDPTHPARFFFTYESGLRYTLRKMKTRDRLPVFKTDSPAFSVSGGGTTALDFRGTNKLILTRLYWIFDCTAKFKTRSSRIILHSAAEYRRILVSSRG